MCRACAPRGWVSEAGAVCCRGGQWVSWGKLDAPQDRGHRRCLEGTESHTHHTPGQEEWNRACEQTGRGASKVPALAAVSLQPASRDSPPQERTKSTKERRGLGGTLSVLAVAHSCLSEFILGVPSSPSVQNSENLHPPVCAGNSRGRDGPGGSRGWWGAVPTEELPPGGSPPWSVFSVSITCLSP